MHYLDCASNSANNLPNQFPYNLIDIFDPTLGSNNQVTVFMDDETDPHFADLYSKEIADVIYWIGFSEGLELNSYEIRNLCDRIKSFVLRTQGE